MPIQKFKSLEEAEKALWNLTPDGEYYNKVRAFYKLFSKLSKFSYPKGVYKFRNLEEAEQHKMNVIINAALMETRTSNGKVKRY
jgi:hypothetical protein